eukprot:COSAG02_NODE_47577_length_340_cov_0.726141_1_plen_41_part_01
MLESMNVAVAVAVLVVVVGCVAVVVACHNHCCWPTVRNELD